MWLLLGTVGASEFLDGLDREFPLFLGGLSGKLPMAGVDGLLARPLFVVVTCCVVGVVVTDGVDSFRVSSSTGFAEPSFFWPPLTVVEDGVGARSLCCLDGSVLTVALGGGSISDFELASLLGPWVLGVGISNGAGTLPFGLFDAAEGGFCRALSTFDAIELWRTLEDAGRAGSDGAGDARGTFKLSGKVAITGEEATDGEAPGPFL